MTQIKYHKAPHPETKQDGYVNIGKYRYYSTRYKRCITVEDGMWSDGATGFIDLGAGGLMSRLFAWIRNRLHKMLGNKQSGWFFVHDKICNTGLWDIGDDYTCNEDTHEWQPDERSNDNVICKHCYSQEYILDYKITNLQASMVAMDILIADGWPILAPLIGVATFAFGGGEARKNGMMRL